MKIKVTDKTYEEVLSLPREKHIYPVKQKKFYRMLMKLLAKKELKDTNFRYNEVGMEKLNPREVALFLMNHSSFTDLSIATTLLGDRQYHIVMTNDGMIGKAGLMRKIGCIPTKKFITDTMLIKDMVYAVNHLNSSILMYPEASYSFDGTQTPLPDSLGKCIKLLKIPVVMIRTKGAFLRDPLYNNLQKRKVDVSATVKYIISKQDAIDKSEDEINAILKEAFTYDHFKEQVASGIIIDEDFRADGLERVLYKCLKCGCEDQMLGAGTKISCQNCGDTHELMPDGRLRHEGGPTKYEFVTDWYSYERDAVLEEIKLGTYKLDTDVDIMMLVDNKSMYRIGSGHLAHSSEGFELTGADGKLHFTMSVKKSYSLYADYFWYEIGDMIAIGDSKVQYYCFPKSRLPVAKTRLAAEELYKLKIESSKNNNPGNK